MRNLLFLLLLFPSALHAWSFEDIPNPKSINNTYVSDPHAYLGQQTQNELNRICKQLFKEQEVEVAIVLVNSTAPLTPKVFCTELFKHWGIGLKQNNAGLLILFVKDAKRIEFETGYGLESVLTDKNCYQIQQNHMIPYFKKGQLDEGFISGVKAIQKKLSAQGGQITGIETNKVATKDNSSFLLTIIVWFVLIYLLYFILFALFHLWLFLNYKDPYIKFGKARFINSKFWYFPFTFMAVIAIKINREIMENWRNETRFSERTGLPMKKLSEKDEDIHLESGQMIEEKIKSIDYDVWTTEDQLDVLILSYAYNNSGYKSCEKCGHKTYSLDYDSILKEATTIRKGNGQKKYSCKNCNHQLILDYDIPKLHVYVTDHSWDAGGGGWSSGSSGGSWGGGSSGGGGAGSSW